MTKVKCNATDSSGNTEKKTFLIKVNDTVSPDTSIVSVHSNFIDNITNQQLITSDDINFVFIGYDKVGIGGYECKIDNENWIKAQKLDYSDIRTQHCPYQQSSNFGFLNINFKENGAILEGKFYSNSGVVLDKFSISKEMGKAEENKPPKAVDDFLYYPTTCVTPLLSYTCLGVM